MVLLGPYTITIDSTDVTELVDAESLDIQNAITRAVDTCSFLLTDFDGTLETAGFSPLEAELVITDSNDLRVFGGIIKTANEETVRIEDQWREAWDIQASDYTDLLQREIILQTYEAMTDAEIIQDAVAAYAPTVDTTNVQSSGVTYTRFVAGRIRLVELLDKLAAASGFDWYVDPDAQLHYFPTDTYSAPFNISDTPDGVETFSPYDLVYSQDSTELCNDIVVIGGSTRSTDQTFYLPGNGNTLEVGLPYPLHAPSGFTSIQVSRNTGTLGSPVWSAPLSVGIDNIDSPSGVAVLYNFNEKLLKFGTAPANLANAIRVIGQYEVPILVRRKSFASFDTYGAWYSDKHVDNQIKDSETAQQVARSILAERSHHHARLSFWTWEHGLRAGQTIHLTDSGKGLDDDFLIQSVRIAYQGEDAIRYDIEAGSANPDLVDLMLDIRRRQFAEDDTTTDEVLTEILGIADRLRLSGVFSIVASSGVYKYSPTGDGVFTWGAARWG